MSQEKKREIKPDLAAAIRRFIDDEIIYDAGDVQHGLEWQARLASRLNYIPASDEYDPETGKRRKGLPDFAQDYNFDLKTVLGKNNEITCSNIPKKYIETEEVPYDLIILRIEKVVVKEEGKKRIDQRPVSGVFIPSGGWTFSKYRVDTRVALTVPPEVMEHYTFYRRELPEIQTSREKTLSETPARDNLGFGNTPAGNASGFENTPAGNASGFENTRF